MLQHMRDNSKGVISGILIGLLVIIFAISGAEALFTWDASKGKVLSVNGEAISEPEVVRAIAMRKQQILSRYGETVPAEFLTDEKLRQPAIDSLIQRSLMIQAAKKGGLAANTDSLHKDILATSAFQKEGGVFDQAKYIQLLGYQGFTPASYQTALADDSVINQLQDTIAYTAFVTPVELKNIVGLSFQTRSFSYAVIPADKVEKAVVVNDSDIQAHYAANPQSYTLPERVAVDYIELSTAELAKNITISDEQAQKQFEQNSKNFVAKVEREAAHILLDDSALATAVELKAKLDAGGDFAALAKQYSTDTGSKEQGGTLGVTTGDAFPAEFEAALAKLKVGEVSAPVKTSAGIHIIKLLAERGAQPPTFAEAKAAIVEQLKSAEADAQFAEKMKRLGDASYNADNLAVVAKELGLNLQNTQLFAKEGGKDLTANPLFVDAAFSPEVLEQGNASDVIELEASRVVVLKKTDRKPSELQPLDAVKAKITEVVRAEKTQALLAQQGQSFIAALNSGKSMAEQAKAAGVELKALAAASRSEKDTDRELLQYVFKLPTPLATAPVLGSVRLAKGDLAVVSLTAVTLGADDKVPAEQKTSIATQLANINGEYDLKSVQTHLQEVADIKRK